MQRMSTAELPAFSTGRFRAEREADWIAFDLLLTRLEKKGAAALTNTLTFFHAGAQWASQEFGLVLKSGTRWTSPLGHVWIFGGGYVEGLDQTIVATSQPYGWRDAPTTRNAVDRLNNIYAAVAERSVTIGYEALVAAVTIAP